MTMILETRHSSRNPLTVFAAAFTVFALGLAAYHQAPWYIWAIWGPCGALLVWMVAANRVCALQVHTDRIRLRNGDRWRQIALSDVARIEITTWSDGADSGAIVLRSGAEVRMTTGTVPQAERLVEALAGHNISVLRDGTLVTPH